MVSSLQYPAVDRLTAALDTLAGAQSGVLSHGQLRALGVGHEQVEANLIARRWSRRTPRVLTVTTGPLSVEQRRWVAVLHAGRGSLLGGLTALEVAGLSGWSRDEVTLLVDSESSFEPVPGVRFVRTRRSLSAFKEPVGGLPRASVEPAVLLFASKEPVTRTAYGAVAACVQQRLTTPEDLAAWMLRLRPLRRAAGLRALLADLAGGSQSLSEVDVLRMCDQAGLQRPHRQTRRRGSDGRWRFTDCEWDLRDGTTLVLEVDGAFHIDVLQYTQDARRQRSLTRPGTLIIRCTSHEVRHEPWVVTADLIALGVPPAR